MSANHIPPTTCTRCERSFTWRAALVAHEKAHDLRERRKIAEAPGTSRLRAPIAEMKPTERKGRIAPLGLVPDDDMLPEGHWALEIIRAEEIEHEHLLAYQLDFATIAPKVGYFFSRLYVIGTEHDLLAFSNKTWIKSDAARALKLIVAKAGYVVRAEVNMLEAMAFLVGKQVEVQTKTVAGPDGELIVHFEQVDPIGTSFDAPEVSPVLPPQPRKGPPPRPIPTNPLEEDDRYAYELAERALRKQQQPAQAGNYICGICGQEKPQDIREIHERNCRAAAGAA